jgi:hypothetical protein
MSADTPKEPPEQEGAPEEVAGEEDPRPSADATDEAESQRVEARPPDTPALTGETPPSPKVAKVVEEEAEIESGAPAAQSVDTEEAQHLLAQLFAAAGIKRIVCVDDVFAASIDTLIEQLAAFTPEQRADVFDGDAEEFTPDEVWQQRAGDEWERRAEPEQASLVDRAYAIAGEIEPVTKGAVHALQSVLPEALKPEGLSLSEWRDRKESLIAGTVTNPTLILFDQDFSHEGAGSEEGQAIIADLEASLKDAQAVDNVYYGLLTNKVDPENEHERRREIVREASLDPKRLVVISKRNLDNEELERFATRMRSTLLAPALAGLTSAVTGALAAEQAVAIEHMELMAPEELERIVIRASEREGDWPPDTLVRVLAAMQRVKVREQLRIAPQVEQLTSRLQAIAAVSGAAETRAAPSSGGAVAPRTVEPLRYPAAAEIMREEFYDDAEHLNCLHLPIELGDVIERPSDGELWVVVAQPCALMVRDSGRRTPEMTHTTLAKLRRVERDVEMLFSEFELPYFDKNGQDVVVHLGRAAYPRAVILDACVLNDDGRSRLDLQAISATRLLPHWRGRHDDLKKIGTSLLTRVSRVKKDSIANDAIVGHYKSDPFKPTKVDRDAEVIEWDCRRAGRVGEPYARALLTRFSQYQARDAFLNDLAR